MDKNQPISKIMTTDVEVVTPDQKILDVKHIYEKRNFHHHIPVVEDNQLVGMVSLVDFMRKIHNATLDDSEAVYNEVKVEEIMSRSPAFVTSDTPIETVAKELSKGEVHAYVVADNGEVKGIISTADMIKYFLED
ncbi:CBS domain-containing protein [Paracrocinitomix mangrovi]|uniref:CBS domain-containing protein n=1 Tax=Paracrocinitomix mangrovi TaxID=2862509 RepID=UPI001C8DCB33|nr:CBS domain-containing protein [Paracrocinitomix mangrovi]UKN03145.1 CBS domain-containing protein [Paracrocinitomix mangrovi]